MMPNSSFNTWTFLVLLLLSFILVVHLLFAFITPVVLALVIVSLTQPFYQWLNQRLGNKSYLSSSICTFLVFLCIMIPLVLFFVSLTKQALSLYQITSDMEQTGELNTWIKVLQTKLQWLQGYLGRFDIIISSEKILKMGAKFSQSLGKGIYDSLSTIASNLISLVFNFALCVMMVFVFFISGSSIKQFFMDLVPLPHDEKEQLVQKFRELSSAIFFSNGLVSVMEGVIGGFLFWLFDLPGAIIWGVVMTILSFLPVIGASLVVIPAGIYLFLQGHSTAALVFLILNTIQLGLLETFLKTHLIGHKSQMHDVLVFLAIIGGVQVYGLLGLFYGPLLVTMFLSLAQIYKEHYRNRLLNIKRSS